MDRANFAVVRPPHQILYRAAVLAALMLALLPAMAWAQNDTDVPLITPRTGPSNKKKDQGPRALGLLQLSSTGKTTLIPIVIQINGRFYDASAYKADPVPMSLDSGTVYEAERTGNSLGLFTVNGALHSDSPQNPHPWLGTGTYLPAGTEAPKSGLKAESMPVGLEPVDAPPRLSKGGSKPKSDTATAPSTQAPSDKKTPAAPPTDQKPADGKQPETKPAEKPQEKPAEKKEPSDTSSSFGSDANRPRLRRGKPTEPLPSDDDIPGYSRPGTSGSKSNPATAGTLAPVQLVPAISDATGPDPRSFEFQWDKAEEDKRRNQMLDLAQAYVATYAAERAKSRIEAAPAKPATRRANTKPPKPELENVQIRAFDLWTNNQPILVLTANAHLPATATGPSDAGQYTITLVTRTDIYSNLHPLYSGVTDAFHLDVTPRLDLIDVVDVDGDGRGELLFEETSDTGKGYVIYRATIDKLWKMYDSLNQQ